MKVHDNADQAWNTLLRDVQQYGHKVAPRGKPCLELLGYQSAFDMRYPIVTAPARKLGYKFQAAEAAWILSGSNLVEDIAPFSKEISRFSDDGIRFAGSYGPPIADQIAYAADAIIKDPDTRQAVINIWRNNPRPSKDIPCTLSLQWLVRNGKIHCLATMRSSDSWMGYCYDAFNFTMITAYLVLYIARVANVKYQLGTLKLTAGSQHIYESDQAKVKEVLDSTAPFVKCIPFDFDAFRMSPQLFVDMLWFIARGGGSLDWLKDTKA